MSWIVYGLFAAWFFSFDMAAGAVAGSKPRPLAGAALALIWPITVAFTLVGSAIMVRQLRQHQNDADDALADLADDAGRYRWIRWNRGCPLVGWPEAETDAERDAAVDACMDATDDRWELTEAGRAMRGGK